MLPFVFKWLGRVAALLLFVIWGAFFFEHVTEWFLHQRDLPPASVWLSIAFHGAMLAGLLMMLKWFYAGSVTTIMATFAFFSTIGMRRFPFLALINLLPVVSFAVGLFLSRHYEGEDDTTAGIQA